MRFIWVFYRVEIVRKCEAAVREEAAKRLSPGTNQYTDRSVEKFPPTTKIKSRDELGALRLKPILAEKAKEKQLETLKQNATVSQNSVERKPMDTQKDLAAIAGVSHDTIHKVETSTPHSPLDGCMWWLPMTYRVLMVGIFCRSDVYEVLYSHTHCRSEIDISCVAAGGVEQRQIYPIRFTTRKRGYLRKRREKSY